MRRYGLKLAIVGALLLGMAGGAVVAQESSGPAGDAPRGGAAEDSATLEEGRPVVSASVALQPEYYVNLPRADFAEQLLREAPLVLLGLAMEADNGALLRARAVLQREWPIDSATNLPVPVEGNPIPVENNLLWEGILRIPVGPLMTTVGRQQVALGPDPLDSLYVSERVPFLDAIQSMLSLGPLTMTHVISTLENRRAAPDTVVPDRALYDFGTNIILYNIHYYSWDWGPLQTGFGSQVLIARAMNQFQLGDFFPVFSWHQADITPNNMSLVGDVVFQLGRAGEAFLQYGWDDISAETFGFADTVVPTIDAYLGGWRGEWSLSGAGGLRGGARGDGRVGGRPGGDEPADGSVETTPGRPTSDSAPPLLSADLLAGYTHYLWGNFEDANSLARAIYRLEGDGTRPSMPLTSPYGPGALWFRARASLEWRGARAALRYRALGRKPGVDLYTTSYASSDAIEATARTWNHRVQLEAEHLAEEVFSGAGLGLALIPEFRWGTDGTAFGLEVSGFFRYHASTLVAE